jgi:hypothetical protein
LIEGRIEGTGMRRTGTLRIESEESRLDGTLLARRGENDPLGAATSFLRTRGLNDNDTINVTGDDGKLGTRDVIYMTDAERVSALVATPTAALTAMAPKRSPSRKRAGEAAPHKRGKRAPGKRVSIKKPKLGAAGQKKTRAKRGGSTK